MNLITFVFAAFILVLFVLAVRRIRKKGTCDCSSCDSAAGCPHCETAKGGK